MRKRVQTPVREAIPDSLWKVPLQIGPDWPSYALRA